jgi:hypothetical protein
VERPAESCLEAAVAATTKVADAAPKNEPTKTNHQNDPHGEQRPEQLLPATM